MKTTRISRRSFIAALGASAAGLSLSGGRALAAEEKRLNFYNWDTYIGETTLDDFKGVSGVEVKMDLFGDNDELFAKIREGNPGYDVIVPSNDYVDRMWRAGIWKNLTTPKFPISKRISPRPFKTRLLTRAAPIPCPICGGQWVSLIASPR